MNILRSLKFGVNFSNKEDKRNENKESQPTQIESHKTISEGNDLPSFPDCSRYVKKIKLYRKKINELTKADDDKEALINEYKINLIKEKIDKLSSLLFEKLKYSVSESENSQFYPLCSFKEMKKYLKCNDKFIDIMSKYEYVNPSPVQSIVIPYLYEKMNLIVTSATGSGKTLSYLIPIIVNLDKLKSNNKLKNCLIIAPTKELCNQILNEAKVFSNYYCSSEVKSKLIISSMLSSCSGDEESFKHFINNNQIIIGTPNNILALLSLFNSVLLSRLNFIIFDEADKMLDKGSFDNNVYSIIDTILEYEQKRISKMNKQGAINLNKNIVKAFFSATINSKLADYLETRILNIKRIEIGNTYLPCDSVEQEFKYCTNYQGKIFEITNFLGNKIVPPILVFVDSIENGKKLFEEIKFKIPKINLLHSHMTKESREELIKKFRVGDVWVLITSDLLARGIDFKNVKTVINFDCPENYSTYIHRVGRTGRGGNKGNAITYVVDEEKEKLRNLNNILRNGSNIICANWMKKSNRYIK